MSFKRKPAGSLDSLFSSVGGGNVGSSDISAFGDMLIELGGSLKSFADFKLSGFSSES